MKTVARPIIVVVIMLTLAVSLPRLCAGCGCGDCKRARHRSVEGVVCTGPTVPPNYLPVVQSHRQCPQQVGEGVICTGPEVPPYVVPAEGQIRNQYLTDVCWAVPTHDQPVIKNSTAAG